MPAPAPALSVIMSVYNDAPFVGTAIESILTQSFTDFEFLIVDDHSADGSEAVLHEWAGRDARIRVLSRGEKGRVPALNRLLGEARGERIALMDSDDWCEPERFAKEMGFLDAHPDHGAVSCNCAVIDEAGNPFWRPPIDRPLTHEGILANLESGPLLNHNAVLFTRAALDAVGGYRAAYRHAEDYDLWLRLSRVTRLANLEENLVAYRIYPGQVSTAHIIEQTTNAGIAWLAHCATLAGQPDPTEGLPSLPALDELDTLFGPGAAAKVRRRVIERTLFAPDLLAAQGWPLLLDHARETEARGPLWRVAARLLKHRHPARAARLAAALVGA
ncbi:glycosyltransferase [Novosphingobium sp. 1949]|uniref:Glycosyltransferase n=1 Tax=Novosphingobium organovorum TaxID=2930092 RepID=A0ABT0BFN8_9SPHN|nr:glycosyltransferase [Novosphingobium organovorum]MCJ2183836.1 glycosyltransferase [Novosphingobium organovorum]